MRSLILIIIGVTVLFALFFWLDADLGISLRQSLPPAPPAKTSTQDRLLVCNLVSAPIVELGYTPEGKVNKQRQCNFLCQDKSEITVHTNTEYDCPQTLYD